MAKHEHQFDPLSGYCNRCGLRDDGRLISRNGDEYQPGGRWPAPDQEDNSD
jgi:hypothetical protein